MSHKYRYRKGANLEYRLRDRLVQEGWIVIRSAGSKKPDLVCIRENGQSIEVMFVECKYNGRLRAEDKARLRTLKSMVPAAKIMLAYKAERGVAMRELTQEDLNR